MLPKVEKEIATLEKKGSSDGKNGKDDLCLAWFLEGVCCRYLAYPVEYQPLKGEHIFLTLTLHYGYTGTNCACRSR